MHAPHGSLPQAGEHNRQKSPSRRTGARMTATPSRRPRGCRLIESAPESRSCRAMLRRAAPPRPLSEGREKACLRAAAAASNPGGADTISRFSAESHTRTCTAAGAGLGRERGSATLRLVGVVRSAARYRMARSHHDVGDTAAHDSLTGAPVVASTDTASVAKRRRPDRCWAASTAVHRARPRRRVRHGLERAAWPSERPRRRRGRRQEVYPRPRN